MSKFIDLLARRLPAYEPRTEYMLSGNYRHAFPITIARYHVNLSIHSNLSVEPPGHMLRAPLLLL